MIDLTGKHICIAGGSRGIGRAAALMAAKAGAAVSINYVSNEEAANSLLAEIAEFGGKAWAFKADISVDGAIDGPMQEAVERLGPLDGLVVSAGIFEPSPIAEMTAEFWDRVMAINLRGTFLAVRAAVRLMRPQKQGSIVIYTSTAGQRGSAVYSAYATSKGAQILFMRSMASELAPDRIRVNCVAPAWTDTDMANPVIDSIGRDQVIAGVPLGRIGLPKDIAAATTFLLSDVAEFITGSTITVDGGQDMRG